MKRIAYISWGKIDAVVKVPIANKTWSDITTSVWDNVANNLYDQTQLINSVGFLIHNMTEIQLIHEENKNTIEDPQLRFNINLNV